MLRGSRVGRLVVAVHHHRIRSEVGEPRERYFQLHRFAEDDSGGREEHCAPREACRPDVLEGLCRALEFEDRDLEGPRLTLV